MRRESCGPRPNWQAEVEHWGLLYHTHMGKPYWYESAYYVLDYEDVERIESATNELHQLCLQVVDSIVTSGDYHGFDIPENVIPVIEKAWSVHQPALYGRFDLAYDCTSAPKMLEYNADTPTALLEAAVIQWQWAQSIFPGSDQFNSLCETLVERWKFLKASWISGNQIWFGHEESVEDTMTISLLRDTAVQAGFETEGIYMEDIGWKSDKKVFVDLHDVHIKGIFKLYPWEWMVHEEFGNNMLSTYMNHFWIEPIWKMLLSNKAILVRLWEKFPNHPNLLPAFFDSPKTMSHYVKKPILSREGANVTIYDGGIVQEETHGDYAGGRSVFQELASLSEFEGNFPIIGSWVIGDESAGVGIRESDGRITTDLSRFVPNIIQD